MNALLELACKWLFAIILPPVAGCALWLAIRKKPWKDFVTIAVVILTLQSLFRAILPTHGMDWPYLAAAAMTLLTTGMGLAGLCIRVLTKDRP